MLQPCGECIFSLTLVTRSMQTHNDYIFHQRERAEGVRILTVFLYLNDVEEGGGTDFPKLGITVEPKKGKAVIWPSVLNDRPDMKDWRTDHQALPVIAGVKYGANAVSVHRLLVMLYSARSEFSYFRL